MKIRQGKTSKRPSGRLTPKQERFVAEYLKDLNATQAAKRAGYSAKRADQSGYQALSNPAVVFAIEIGKKRQLARAELSAVRVLEEARRIGMSDIRRCFDENGDLLPIQNLSDEDASAISSVEFVMKNEHAGDNKVDHVGKIKLWNKPQALELLFKHLGLLATGEQSQHYSGPVFVMPEGTKVAIK